MNKYPFIFLNHGELDIEYVDKCEELFVWFSREINDDERERIMKNCPSPVNSVYHWGKEFVYFGSNGDTYDTELAVMYGSDNKDLKKNIAEFKSNNDESDDMNFDEYEDGPDNDDYYRALKRALPMFQKDLEKWIIGVNDIAPISVFMGPNCQEIDAWGEWSKKEIYKTAASAIKSYRTRHPDIFETENEEAKYLCYIYDIITDYSSDENSSGLSMYDLLVDMEFTYDMDGMKDSFDRLNINDHKLQRNANKLYKILSGLPRDKRVEMINTLKPYTQFAYYASYAASKDNDLLENENPVEFLKNLITALPEDRKGVAGTFLRFIALNLAHIGPGFSGNDKNDRTHACLASQIIEMSLEYEENENAYIYCATFYDWSKDYESMLRVSLEAVKKYPHNDSIIANVMYSAGNCGKPELAEKYVQIKSDDPLIIANQSFALVKSGRLKEAYELLLGHYGNNGKFNAYSFNNLLYVCNYYKRPEKKTLDGIIEKAEKKFFMDAEYSNADFVNSLVILLGNIEPKRAVRVFVSFRKDGGFTHCSLWCNYTYAASKTDDKEMIKKSIDDFLEEYSADPDKFKNDTANYWLVLANIACEYAQIGDKTHILEYLKLVKDIHPNFKSMKKDPDFKEYWNDPDFLKLFLYSEDNLNIPKLISKQAEFYSLPKNFLAKLNKNKNMIPLSRDEISKIKLAKNRIGSEVIDLPRSIQTILSVDKNFTINSKYFDKPLLKIFFERMDTNKVVHSAEISNEAKKLFKGTDLNGQDLLWNDTESMPALIELYSPGDQRVYLYLGNPDENGEFPIARFDCQPEMWISESSIIEYILSKSEIKISEINFALDLEKAQRINEIIINKEWWHENFKLPKGSSKNYLKTLKR